MFKGHQIRPIKANGRLLLSLFIGSGLSVHIKAIIHISLFFLSRSLHQKNETPKGLFQEQQQITKVR